MIQGMELFIVNVDVKGIEFHHCIIAEDKALQFMKEIRDLTLLSMVYGI